jgi:Flp pilus assembly protein TadG
MIHKSRSDSGQAIVEFALVLPILIILLLGITDFGIALYDQAVITNASREGARAGIKFMTDSDGNYSPLSLTAIQTVVHDYWQPRLIAFDGNTPDPAIAQTTGTSPEYGGNGHVDVTVTYTHKFLAIPSFLGMLNNTVTMNVKTIMRLE